MINCAFCQSEIEDDSFYCDQCGKEILVCTQCSKPGSGKRCTEDGKPLVAVKDKATQVANNPINPPILPNVPGSNLSTQSSVIARSELVLKNSEKGITIKAKDGDIIGRTNGSHSSIFGAYGGISSAHAQITFDQEKNCWFIKDLGSTNGTRISSGQTDWRTITDLSPNVLVTLKHGQFLLIGRTLELTVQLIQDDLRETTNGTIRI